MSKITKFCFCILIFITACGDSLQRPSVVNNRLTAPFSNLQNSPPVVIETFPESGDSNVDHNLDLIKVTFSMEMNDKSWSWVKTSNESFPEINRDPVFDIRKRTISLPVKLKPNTTYIIWLNQGSNLNFKGANDRSAIPYLLTFKTSA